MEYLALLAQYQNLQENIAHILFDHDPMGIAHLGQSDAYQPEAEALIPLLTSLQSKEELAAVIYQVFCDWFEPAIVPLVDSAIMQQIADAIWLFWQQQAAN
ncbi:hypothetical protein VST7929_03024 [Vibrio stylophorae]|uniref:Uncharacterized protein n=1 Tax=Vibrio stylophorae TaxID=659351 RepID=A0ABM8ZXJ8_9VIBR|nr:hypothetical protein [Vibrio stylophorae]CAH0535450.1 hypothetical protein VST7929_03024 [Vibrio stylophorae]